MFVLYIALLVIVPGRAKGLMLIALDANGEANRRLCRLALNKSLVPESLFSTEDSVVLVEKIVSKIELTTTDAVVGETRISLLTMIWNQSIDTP